MKIYEEKKEKMMSKETKNYTNSKLTVCKSGADAEIVKEAKKKLVDPILSAIPSFKQKLLSARIEINNPTRGGTDNFKKRKYVTLQDLYDAVLPHLLYEGLLLINTKIHDEKGYFLKTEIIDVDSDESITTYAMLNPDLKIQEHGAELTYHSRYNLGCLLSIRTDYDDDADSIKNKEIKKAQNYITADQMHGLTHVLSSLTVSQYNELLRILSIKDFSKVPKDKYEKTVQFIRNYIDKHVEGETKGEDK